ncbi:MAG: DUF1501 domain-containing protein [Planctomycetota bacterium]
MPSRRRLLTRAMSVAAGGGWLSSSPFLPSFVRGSVAHASEPPLNTSRDRILVLIQLDGGNDGLNCVVPHAQEPYLQKRPEIGLRGNQLLKINDELSFHGSMRAMADLLEDGRLAVVQNVGYPNPDRSHFRSMAIWHTGFNEDELPTNGWAARALEPQAGDATDAIFVGEQELPLSLQSRKTVVTSVSPNQQLRLKSPIDPMSVLASHHAEVASHDFVQRSVLNAYSAAKKLSQPSKSEPVASYPASQLGRSLRTTADFIRIESTARVYCSIQSGYDTHQNQQASHGRLLEDFSESVKAFLDDMQAIQMQDRVVVMAFSEFGRRVTENGSAGTDHGTAGPVFVAGSPVNAGLIGQVPDLTNLAGDDLTMEFDFRRIYASLQTWLGCPDASITNNFDPLALFS